MQKPLYIPLYTVSSNNTDCTGLVKYGDTLELTLKVFDDTGKVLHLTGKTVNLVIKKQDATIYQETLTNITDTTEYITGARKTQYIGSEITTLLDVQATNSVGKLHGELQISDTNGSITTNTFTLLVVPNLSDLIIENSVDEIKILSELIEALKEYIELSISVAGTIKPIQALSEIKNYIDTNLPLLQSANSQALTNITNEGVANDELETAISTAIALKSELDDFVAAHADITNLINAVNTHSEDINQINADLSDIAYRFENFPRLTGETDDTARFERVFASMPSGATLMLDCDITYVISSMITVTKSFKLLGSSPVKRSIITCTTNISHAITSTATDVSIIFENIEFRGGVIDGGETYSRTRSKNDSFRTAMNITGAKELVINNCFFRNIEDIPIYVYQCKSVTFTNSYSDYCFDLGFVDNDRVIFTNNRITRSGDNGFSISRLNDKCIVSKNIVENSYYSGIFCAGFVGDAGVSKTIITDNIILNSNKYGIELIAGSSDYIVSNNYINGVTRKSENESVTLKCGIGIATGNHANGTIAKNVNINNNTIINCERGGVLLSSPKYFKVNDNLIVDFGSLLDHLGTLVTDYDINNQPQNFGISVTSDSYYGDIFNNKLKDTRSDKTIVKFPIFINNLSYNIELHGNRIQGLKTLFGNSNISAFTGNNKNLDAPKQTMLKSPHFTKCNGYSAWSTGVLSYEDNVLNITCAESQEAGASCTMSDSYYYKNKLRFELEFSSDTSIQSAGILIDWKKNDATYDRKIIKLVDYIPNFVVNRVYTISDEVITTVTKAEFNSYQVILVGNLTTFDSTRPAKVLKVYNFNVY